MFLQQARQLRPKLAFFLFCHLRLWSRLGCASAGFDRYSALWIIAFWLISDKPVGRMGGTHPCVHSGIFGVRGNGV